MNRAQRRSADRAARFIENNPILFFDPSPKQKAFIDSAAMRALCRAGNGTGKTKSAAVKAWKWLEANPEKTLLILCATHRIKVSGVGRALWDTAPRQRLIGSDYNKRRGWRNDVIELDNGASVILYAAGVGDTGNTIRLESVNADALWLDEPPPANLMSAAMARVRRPTQSQVWMTMTPVGRDVAGVRELVEQGNWEDHNIHMTVEDCPWMTEEDIEEYCSVFRPGQYMQRRYGDWEGETIDRALVRFSEECVTDFIPHLEWQIGFGADHGELAGHEAIGLWLWNEEKKLAIILDEYESPEDTDLDQDVEGIKRMFARHDIPLDAIDQARGDINSAGKMVSGRVSINKLMGQALGIRIRPADKRPGSVHYGTRLLDIAFGRGHLLVHKRCKRHIHAFRHWAGKNDDLKHWVDQARYIGKPVLERLYDPRTIERIRMGVG